MWYDNDRWEEIARKRINTLSLWTEYLKGHTVAITSTHWCVSKTVRLLSGQPKNKIYSNMEYSVFLFNHGTMEIFACL